MLTLELKLDLNFKWLIMSFLLDKCGLGLGVAFALQPLPGKLLSQLDIGVRLGARSREAFADIYFIYQR
jgi:hypothetical protein